eukprot:tig00020553_g10609.t1
MKDPVEPDFVVFDEPRTTLRMLRDEMFKECNEDLKEIWKHVPPAPKPQPPAPPEDLIAKTAVEDSTCRQLFAAQPADQDVDASQQPAPATAISCSPPQKATVDVHDCAPHSPLAPSPEPIALSATVTATNESELTENKAEEAAPPAPAASPDVPGRVPVFLFFVPVEVDPVPPTPAPAEEVLCPPRRRS